MQIILYGLLIVCTIPVYADDPITVHNKTKDVVFARVYCVPIFNSKQARGEALYELNPADATGVVRPKKSIECTRNLAFAFSQTELPEVIDKKKFEALPSIGIGLVTGGRIFDNFFVAKDRFGKLKAYNPLTWQPYELLAQYEQQLIKRSVLVKDNKHKDEVAHVRIGAQISPEEQAYIKQRMPKVKLALETFLGKKLNGSFIPKIACINSGGGARSLISCIGWHSGAHAIGLLDAVTYDIGLSGGSWFVMTWLESGKSITEFKDFMRPIMGQKLVSSADARQIFDAIVIREALEQPITMVNPWGALLANRYFAIYGDKRQAVLFSDAAHKIKNADWPFPIITAVNGYSFDVHAKRHLMDWFEWTPYEASGVGKWLGNAHIPTWGFGRKYSKHVSVDFHPEYDAGLLMGICGSAFASTYARAYEEIITTAIKGIPLFKDVVESVSSKFVNDILSQETRDKALIKRFSVSKAYNFAKDISGSQVKQDQLRLVDGGIAFNLPIPSALVRKADVLILCDAGGAAFGVELQLIEKYVQAHNYAFPKIILDGTDKRAATIFAPEKNTHAPLVIYMPNIDPTGKIKTNFDVVKFQYTVGEYDGLTGAMQQNMQQSARDIKQALIELIEQHNGFQEEESKGA